jgi:hypothetical protein
MLGETRDQVDARERRRHWRELLSVAMPPNLVRFRPDVAGRQLDRLLEGPPPRPNKWNPYSHWQQLAYYMWKCLLGLQAQQRKLEEGYVT